MMCNLRIARVVIQMITISYFYAMFFKIVIDIQQDIFSVDWFGVIERGTEEEWYYSTYLEGNSESYQTIQLIYFAFTSLTTIGLGDLNPKSDIERIAIAFSLLSGVILYSFGRGKLIEIILEYEKISS